MGTNKKFEEMSKRNAEKQSSPRSRGRSSSKSNSSERRGKKKSAALWGPGAKSKEKEEQSQISRGRGRGRGQRGRGGNQLIASRDEPVRGGRRNEDTNRSGNSGMIFNISRPPQNISDDEEPEEEFDY